jgi:hypothetical protein
MVTKFERSGILFKPQVYHSFTIKNKETNEVEYFVQDLPQQKVEEASEFMFKHSAKYETFKRAMDAPKEALIKFYRFILSQKVSLACFKKDSGELVGLDILSVMSKGVETNFKVNNQFNV